MANITQLSACPFAVACLAKRSGNFEILEVMFPHEDRKTLMEVYKHPERMSEQLVDVDFRSAD